MSEAEIPIMRPKAWVLMRHKQDMLVSAVLLVLQHALSRIFRLLLQ